MCSGTAISSVPGCRPARASGLRGLPAQRAQGLRLRVQRCRVQKPRAQSLNPGLGVGLGRSHDGET